MAHEGRDPGPSPGEKHGWNSFENYRAVHEGSLARHAFVVADDTSFTEITNRDASVSILLAGTVRCEASVVIEVTKLLATRVDPRRGLQVRGLEYRYHAHRLGANLLRYDNHHGADQFDRHVYDFAAQTQTIRVLTRAELPTLIELVDELEVLVRGLGLLA